MAANTRPSVERRNNALGSRQQACISLRYSSDRGTEEGVGARPRLKKALPVADTSPSGSSSCSCLKATHDLPHRAVTGLTNCTLRKNEPVSKAGEDYASSSSLNLDTDAARHKTSSSTDKSGMGGEESPAVGSEASE
ncbi:hypothetical protein XENOCAPTIV_026924 [Xenoophorus captivus]|uniref:Uncharacterized protein n=1 Tax=Xenoophorus captivus TaxID=1517983 RepID=A0ABV0Q6B5_9TELE